MKPYILTLQGFGPFEEKTTIDFTRFDNSLFLITGKTGSGKTTIFDALMYVLFGETSGNERAPKDMRTQNIDAKIKTVVRLEFEHNGRKYLIERTISGNKNHDEDATFRNPEGKIVVKKTPVTTEIKTLLGIEAEQFRMIAMLPQGKFRELLMANSEEKSGILKKLFDTRIYAIFENKLKERDVQFTAEREELNRTIATNIKCLRVPEDDPTYAWLSEAIKNPSTVENNLEDLFTDLQKLAEDDARKIEQIGVQIEELKATQNRILEEKATADNINREIAKTSAARENLEKLLPLEEAYRHNEIRIKQVHAAKAVSGAESAYQGASKARKDIESTIAENTKIIQERRPLLSEIEKAIEMRKNNAEIETIREKRESLKLSLENYKKLAEAESKRTNLDAAMFASMEEAASIADTINTIQEEIQTAEEQTRNLENVEVIATETKNKLENIRSRLQTLEELETREDTLRNLQTTLLTRQQECRTAKETYQESQSVAENLHQRYLDGQAGILADTLSEGMPCPVCGSLTHPTPAIHAESIPDRATVTSAQKAADTARKDWEQKSNAALESKTEHTAKEDEFRTVAGTFVDASGSIEETCNLLATQTQNLRSEKDILEQKAITLAKDAERKQELVERMPKLREDREAKLNEKAQAEKKYSTCSGTLKELERTIADLRKSLPYPTRREAETVLNEYTKKLETNNRELAALQTQKEKLLTETSQATGILENAASRLDAACREETEKNLAYQHARESNGFATIDEYLAVQENSEEIAAIESATADFFKKLETARTELRIAEEDSHGRVPVEIDSLIKRQEELDAELTRLLDIRSGIQRRREDNRKITASISATWKQKQSRIELYTAVHKLAETANGTLTGQERIDLERYIQAVYFTEILRFANNQLLTMSNKRYTLIRPENTMMLRGKRGLDLVVEDRFTGKRRDITTLSGGESFLAALALALGLSEMIQHLSGGISIDALFVDEGFDTLDTDALQDVLKVLWSLTTGNRVVGIISHRGELREQLDRKIVVRKLGNGRSRLEPNY